MAHVSSTTVTQNSSATAKAVTMPAVAAGHTLLIGVCWESSAGSVPTISSVVDSRSNTYTTTPDVSVNAGTTLAVATIRGTVATALQAGDTITITVSVARTRWAIQVDEFDDLKTSPLDKTASNSPGSSASLSTGTTAATTQSSELLYAVWGFGTGRTVTIPGGFTGGAKVETTAGTSDRALQTTWAYVDDVATEAATLTLSSASTYAGVLATYKTTAALVGHVSQVKFEAPLPGAALLARVSQAKFEVPQAVVGEVRVSQVRFEAPRAAGQAPYSGIKAVVGGVLQDASLSAASGGSV